MRPLKRRTAAPAPAAGGADQLAGALRRAGRGDQGAFAELYDALAPTVHGIVVRVLRDPAQSEEVTQEVFVELWRLAPRHDGSRGSVRAWAATIAHRRAVDRVRSEEAARQRSEREAAKAAPPADVVVEAVEADLERARVRRALQRLTDAQREAVELAYYGGHTYQQVAVLLGLPEGTVKSRIRDGLIRLRGELGGAR